MNYRLERVIDGTGVAGTRFADTLRGLAIDADDQLYAVGDSDVKVFSLQGDLVRGWRTELTGYSIAAAEDGTVYVGEPGQVELFDVGGKRLKRWRDPDRLGLVTAIGFSTDNVLLADLKGRCIRRYGRDGRFLNDIGNDNRMRGFLVPNGHVDFAVDRAGAVYAPNPGKHRVERYSLAGDLLGHFGRFDSRDPAGFGGCCNPTNIALTRGGQIVVAEKAPPRVKLYTADGQLLAVMGEKDFDPTCKNMDVAVDAQGRIYVVDTARLRICVFVHESAATATQPATPARDETVRP
jgi:sugar lactone lactonase YvrE